MNKINKALILPIVSLLVLYMKQISNTTFDDNTIDMITEAILSIVTLYGIFIHPTKKEDE